MNRLSKREKTYVGLVLLLLMVLVVKSFWLDAYRPQNEAETDYMKRVEQVLDERYDNVLYKRGVLVYRIVDLDEVTEKELEALRESSVAAGGNLAEQLDGSYKVKVRKYLAGLLPVGHETIHLLDQND